MATQRRMLEARAASQSTPNLRTRCADCPIRERAICSRCDESELGELDSIKTYRSYAAGREIAAAGEPLDHLGTVVSGVIKLTKTQADGRRQLVGLLFPSDFLGRAGEEESRYDAVAATDTTLCLFERRRFETLLTEIPHLENRLLEMTLNELDASREWLFLLGRKTAREKVATFLCMLARRSQIFSVQPLGAQRMLKVEVPLSRDDMADFLGLTIETVSRQMSSLKRDGVIVFDSARALTIPSYDALLEISGDLDE